MSTSRNPRGRRGIRVSAFLTEAEHALLLRAAEEDDRTIQDFLRAAGLRAARGLVPSFETEALATNGAHKTRDER